MAVGWWARPSTSALLSRVEPADATLSREPGDGTRPETGTGGDVRLEARETGRRPPAASTDERAPAVESSDPSASDATAGRDAVETRGTTVPVDDALPPAPLRLPVDEADARAMKGQFGD